MATIGDFVFYQLKLRTDTTSNQHLQSAEKKLKTRNYQLQTPAQSAGIVDEMLKTYSVRILVKVESDCIFQVSNEDT